MESTVKVTWVVEGDDPFGVRTMVLTLAEELHVGACVSFVAMRQGSFETELRAKFEDVRILDSPSRPLVGGSPAVRVAQLARDATRRIPAAVRLARQVDALDADVIHCIWPNLVPLAGLAGAISRRPVIWECPNAFSDDYPADFNRRLFRLLCRTFRVTPVAISDYARSTFWLGEPRPHVVPLSADPHRFDDRTDLRRGDFGIESGSVVIGSVARLQSSKGLHLLAAAIERLSTNVTDRIYLFSVGDESEDGLAASIRTVLGPRFIQLPTVPDPERYYPLFDLYANVRRDPEPFGLSVVEAMLARLPCIVHSLGGPAETVVDGSTGWHVPPMGQELTVSQLVVGLRRALADRPKWKAMGDRGHDRAVEFYGPRRRADGFARIYASALGARSD